MSLKNFLTQTLTALPRYFDVVVLALFTILITLHPHFAHGKINIFEVGLYLPGIQAILSGEIPYRDFFHLRGPFELYMPAFLMKFFGTHIKVLYSYFYFGNILCLILGVLIAKELLKTRFILYLMSFVLIGRTFPRVVFTYWGGMRYAFGLLAIWLVIKFFKENKIGWMFAAGLASACALFTSIEMGIYPLMGVIAALAVSKIFYIQESKSIFSALGAYCVGLSVILIPFGIYLAWNSALLPYVDGVWTIVTRMQKVIDPHFVSVYPQNFIEALSAMSNPLHTNFKHMTPSYLYIFVLIYLGFRIRKKDLSREDLMIICLGIYGFIMYNTGFRGIWAAQFEMALQPEKILLFFLLERVYFYFSAKRREYLSLRNDVLTGPSKAVNFLKVNAINFLIVAFVMSSIGYSIARYNHRFYAYKFTRDQLAGKDTKYLKPLANERTKTLQFDRAKGVIVPEQQANELEQIEAYVRAYVSEQEILFTYPDLGTYNFFFDRRFFGNYPLATFAWFNDRWHNNFLNQLRSEKPNHVIVQKEIPQYWKDVYLALEPNRQKHKDVMEFIASNYRKVDETTLSYVYTLR